MPVFLGARGIMRRVPRIIAAGGSSVTADSFAAGGSTITGGIKTFSSVTFTAGIAVVCFQTETDTGAVLTSVVINGVTATVIDDVHWGGTYYASVSAGTGTIVVTYAGSPTYLSYAMGILHGGSASPSAHSVNTASGADPCVYNSINIPANGIGLAFYNNVATGNAPPYTWTGCDGASSDAEARIAASAPASAINHKSGAVTGWNPTTAGFGSGFNFDFLVSWGP